MEIKSINSLELYVDREIETKNKTVVKRVPLDGDLENGETAYFRSGYRNKIVKQDDEKYIFYRFDEIQTHIEEYDSIYSIGDIIENINSNFDYDLEYASSRVELIDELIDENEWIYDLLSSNRVIQKEQKKKNSFLAEGQALDGQFQRIADYILHPKFNNKEVKKYFEELQESFKGLQQKKGKTNSETVEMMSIKDEIDLISQGIMTKSREHRNKQRENHVDDFVILEATEVFTKEFDSNKGVVKNTGKGLEINKGYWKKMGFSSEGAKFRQGVLDGYEEALKILVEQLGHGKTAEEKEKTRKNTVNSLAEISYINEQGKEVTITSENRFGKLNKLYNELKSDYNDVKEILTTPVSFNQIEPSFTKYDYNSDTWYIDEDGSEVEITKNTVLFSNINTYKGLIENYYNLKDRYKDRFQDDMWAILLDFEYLLEKTDLSDKEKFVVDKIMNDYTRTEIAEEYKSEFGENISMRVVSSWVNRVIPNKLLNTYLDSVNEWLYTYKIKGEFKQCTKCSEVKTINNDRYFRKDRLGRDGFRSNCRKCERLAKQGK